MVFINHNITYYENNIFSNNINTYSINNINLISNNFENNNIYDAEYEIIFNNIINIDLIYLYVHI